MSATSCSAANGSSPRACAVIDDTRVLRLLRSVTDDLSVLADDAGAGEARRADPMRLSGPSALRDVVASVTTWLGRQRT